MRCPVFTDDLLLNLHYLSIVLAILVPLYYWYIKRDRVSPIYRIARFVRIANALIYLAAVVYMVEIFWDEFPLGLDMTAVMIIFSYLLSRKWAPKSLSAKATPQEQLAN